MLLSVGGGVTLRGRDKYIQNDRGREAASALQPQREGEGDDETQRGRELYSKEMKAPPYHPPARLSLISPLLYVVPLFSRRP